MAAQAVIRTFELLESIINYADLPLEEVIHLTQVDVVCRNTVTYSKLIRERVFSELPAYIAGRTFFRVHLSGESMVFVLRDGQDMLYFFGTADASLPWLMVKNTLQVVAYGNASKRWLVWWTDSAGRVIRSTKIRRHQGDLYDFLATFFSDQLDNPTVWDDIA